MAKRQLSGERIRLQLSIDASNPAFTLLARIAENSQRRSLALSLLNTSAALLLSAPSTNAGNAIEIAKSLNPPKEPADTPNTSPALASADPAAQASTGRRPRQRLRDFVELSLLAG